MTNGHGMNRWLVAALVSSVLLVAVNKARSDETASEEKKQEVEASADPAAADPAAADAAQTAADDAPLAKDSAPTPVSSPGPATTPAAAGPASASAAAWTHPYANLRRLPKKLRPVAGQEPPAGYVEIERRKRGLVIAGSVLFGSVYLASVIASMADHMLLIPVAGPMIAGYTAEDEEDEVVYIARLFGTLGTIAQVTGVTLFILGMAQKRKIWLRQDIAGVKFQVTPTLVGRNQPGIGISGTF